MKLSEVFDTCNKLIKSKTKENFSKVNEDFKKQVDNCSSRKSNRWSENNKDLSSVNVLVNNKIFWILKFF